MEARAAYVASLEWECTTSKEHREIRIVASARGDSAAVPATASLELLLSPREAAELRDALDAALWQLLDSVVLKPR